MSGKLKIYACSGIGEAQDGYTYFEDNIDVLSNTQAVNNLLSLIGSERAKLQYTAKTDEEKVDILNAIDLYAVCLQMATDCSGNKEQLKVAGNVIGWFVENGYFQFDSVDDEERDKHLDAIYQEISKAVESGQIFDVNQSFVGWWQKNVIELDKVGLNAEQQNILTSCFANAIEEAKEKGVAGAEDDPEIGKYLKDAGNYFLYLFFTEKELARLPQVFTKKAVYQQQIYNLCKSVYISVYGTEAAMKREIETSITNHYGKTPRQLCKDIASGKTKTEGTGVLTEAAASVIAAAISGLVTLLTSLIAAIFAYKQQTNKDKYQSLNEQIIKDNVPDGADMEGIDYSKLNSKSNSKIWLIGAVGLAALLLLNKKH